MTDQVESGNDGNATPTEGYTPPTGGGEQPPSTDQQTDPTPTQDAPLTTQAISELLDDHFKRVQGLYEKGTKKLRDRVIALEGDGQTTQDAPTADQPDPAKVETQPEKPSSPSAYDTIDRLVEVFDVPVDAPEIEAIVEKSKSTYGDALVQFAYDQISSYRERIANPPSEQVSPGARLGVPAGDGTPVGNNPIADVTDRDQLWQKHKEGQGK